MRYIGIDLRSGEAIPIQEHPRKELLEYFGRSHAQKMFCDLTNGGTRHEGYVIGGHWIRVFGVEGVVFATDYPPGAGP
jgi:ribosomal protein L35AE/L33A